MDARFGLMVMAMMVMVMVARPKEAIFHFWTRLFSRLISEILSVLVFVFLHLDILQ